jgi:hypothetical protein
MRTERRGFTIDERQSKEEENRLSEKTTTGQWESEYITLEKGKRIRLPVKLSELRLIRMWLQSAIIEEKEGKRKKEYPKRGTPQGGVISPLLANIYLHWFDKVFYRAGGPGTWARAKLVRYADDCAPRRQVRRSFNVIV